MWTQVGPLAPEYSKSSQVIPNLWSVQPGLKAFVLEFPTMGTLWVISFVASSQGGMTEQWFSTFRAPRSHVGCLKIQILRLQ